MPSRPPLTFATAAILQALAGGCRHGFEVMDATGLPSGTVYPALRRLESLGLVRSAWEEEATAHAAGRPRRRYYELTAAGLDAAAVARERFRMPGARGPAGDPEPSPA